MVGSEKGASGLGVRMKHELALLVSSGVKSARLQSVRSSVLAPDRTNTHGLKVTDLVSRAGASHKVNLTFPPWTELSKNNCYDYSYDLGEGRENKEYITWSSIIVPTFTFHRFSRFTYGIHLYNRRFSTLVQQKRPHSDASCSKGGHRCPTDAGFEQLVARVFTNQSFSPRPL